MFKFYEYPELEKAYREFERLENKAYSLEKKIRPNDEASRILCDEADANWGAFIKNVFAPLIYNMLKDKKPKLYNHIKNRFSKWDKVFPKEWEECDEDLQNDLLGLVLEIGWGRYWLPDTYYDAKLIEGCLPPPPTHTKPWDFGCDDLSAKPRKKKELSFFEQKDVFNSMIHKFCTVRHGRAFIIIGYCWIFIAVVLGCYFISDEISANIAYGLWVFALLGVAYTIFAYSKKCANYISLNAYGIYFKGKKYKWSDTFVTIQCGDSFKFKRPFNNVVYFSDHYLTQEEIKTRRIKRQGFYMELDERRAYYLLSFYHKRVQLLGNDMYTTSAVRDHNKWINNLANEHFPETTFIDLLNLGEDFIFYYKDVAYDIMMGEDELPSGHTLSLYLTDENKFIKSFIDKDDFLQNGEIDGKKISQIINKIQIEVM